MARTHARILCSIWDDEDFRALRTEAKYLYVLLLSQRSINHAGVLPMTLQRWANCAPNVGIDDVKRWLGELSDTRFVVVDYDTDELLVRSFVRNDGVAKQPNILKAALREAITVQSTKVALVLADELDRIGKAAATETAKTLRAKGLPTPSPTPPEPFANPSSNPNERVVPSGGHEQTPSEPAENPSLGVLTSTNTDDTTATSNPSETLPATPREGMRANAGEGGYLPTRDKDSLRSSLYTSKSKKPAARKHARGDPEFEKFYGAFPRRVERKRAEAAWLKAVNSGVAPSTILAGAERYAEQRKDGDPQFTKHPASWLNAGCWDDETPPPRHLRSVVGGYQPYRNPADESLYNEDLI